MQRLSLTVAAVLALSFASVAAAQDAGVPAPAADADAGTPPPADADAAAPVADSTPPPAEPPPAPVVAAAPVDAAAQFAATATLDHPATDETVWNISAGGTLNSGNTRSFAGNVGTHFSLRRGQHSVGADFQVVYGIAQLRDTSATAMPGTFLPWTESAQNTTATARYDFFLSDADALFVALAGRRDPFAGLDFRGQAQLGYLRNLFAVEKHRVWGEVGYDFTYDDFHFANPPGRPAGTARDRTAHSARFYLGYDNHLNDNVTLTTGVEFLLRPYFLAGQGDFQARLAWITQLNVKVDTRFSIGVNFTLRFDSVPPGFGTPAVKDSLDTITVLNLIYTLI